MDVSFRRLDHRILCHAILFEDDLKVKKNGRRGGGERGTKPKGFPVDVNN